MCLFKSRAIKTINSNSIYNTIFRSPEKCVRLGRKQLEYNTGLLSPTTFPTQFVAGKQYRPSPRPYTELRVMTRRSLPRTDLSDKVAVESFCRLFTVHSSHRYTIIEVRSNRRVWGRNGGNFAKIYILHSRFQRWSRWIILLLIQLRLS